MEFSTQNYGLIILSFIISVFFLFILYYFINIFLLMFLEKLYFSKKNKITLSEYQSLILSSIENEFLTASANVDFGNALYSYIKLTTYLSDFEKFNS